MGGLGAVSNKLDDFSNKMTVDWMAFKKEFLSVFLILFYYDYFEILFHVIDHVNTKCS